MSKVAQINERAKKIMNMPRYRGMSRIPAFNAACREKNYSREDIGKAFVKFVPKEDYYPVPKEKLIDHAVSTSRKP